MKKLLALLVLLGGSYLLTANVFASDCLELSFTDGDICINIDKDDDTYTLNPDLSSTNGTVSLKCDILLPDNTLKNVGACDGDFTYSKEKTEKVKLYVRLNNEYKSKEAYYNFSDGERGSSVGSNSNGDLDNFYLSADDTTPSTSQRVDLTIEARDDSDDTVTDYDGTVDFKVYYRSSSSSSWTLTTSSTYFEIDSDYDNGYEFTSSDDGEADLTNFIQFKKNNYDYKVRVYDDSDTSIYKEITFEVGSSSNSNGFSSSELDQIEALYDSRNDTINQLEDDYSELSNDDTRQNMSDDLYDEMENIINGDDSIYNNYDEFYNEGFSDRRDYTTDIIR
ncbi:MAG: hypothetical protein WAZ12_04230 [Candidatus Absconditicoccaceae bacterium]